MMVSAIRPMMRSAQPPKKPASAPSAEPIVKEAATAVIAMPKSSRAATTMRDRMSRPSESVPNQWATDGGLSANSLLLASGS